MIVRNKKTGRAIKQHGLTKTRFHNIWLRVKQRTLDPNYPESKYYKARGITISERWLSFENFKEDMYQSYLAHCKEYGENKTQIDRIETNGNYELVNCRWVTPQENSSNRRSNVFITRNNETKTLKQWATQTGVNYKQVWQRINKLNWPVEKALTTAIL